MRERMKIYLAGPLFTTAEREFNVKLANLLRNAGHEVWLPQEHEQRHTSAEEVFRKDVEGIEWSEVVLDNMDGPDPHSGTCWECGYAYQAMHTKRGPSSSFARTSAQASNPAKPRTTSCWRSPQLSRSLLLCSSIPRAYPGRSALNLID